MRLFYQSLSLILAFALILIITSTPLDSYIAQVLGLIIASSVIYSIIKARKNRGAEIFTGTNLEVFTVTLGIVLAIFLTGGLSSNLFFLLYFLLFGIVFLFEPLTVFVLLAGLVVVFFTSISDGDLFSNLIKLGSLAFLSPIAFFFGREFKRRDRLAAEVKDKTGQIIEDAQVLKSTNKNESVFDEIEDIEKKASELQKEADE